jgi:sec-independent protein translocase protein TatA
MGLDNPLHIAFLVVVLLLVFGARRLPEIGRSLGSGMREFKTSVTGEMHQAPPTLAPGAPQQQQPAPAQAVPVQAPPAQAPPAQVQAPPVQAPPAQGGHTQAEPVTVPAEQPPAA